MKNIKTEDLVNYLLKKSTKTKEQVEQDIKNEFDSYDKFEAFIK